MRGPQTIPIVQDVFNEDGTVYGIITKVRRALRAAGADTEYLNQYVQKSMLGDYDHLLPTAMEYVTIA